MSLARYDFYTRMMLGGAAVILLGVGIWHATGFVQVAELIAKPAIPNPWREGIRGVWVVYSLHLGIVSALLVYATIRPQAFTGPVLMLCGLFPAVDALLLIAFVGGFFFNVMLGLAAVLVFGAVARGTTPLSSRGQALTN